ncbi:unnamed protein product, partial [Mesorhabditis belari]|uniref:Uncharacterized protein n=1 Tax=Mesorhabditis belari TaxID=2138241 RepID=A0AAF3FED3_9BILA
MLEEIETATGNGTFKRLEWAPSWFTVTPIRKEIHEKPFTTAHKRSTFLITRRRIWIIWQIGDHLHSTPDSMHNFPGLKIDARPTETWLVDNFNDDNFNNLNDDLNREERGV